MNTNLLPFTPDRNSVVTMESLEDNKGGKEGLLHQFFELSQSNCNEYKSMRRFRAAVNKAYRILKTLGFSYEETISSIFKTLVPKCKEFSEEGYRVMMQEEITKLTLNGVTNNEDIIMIFIGRLESSVKMREENWMQYAKKRTMIIPSTNNGGKRNKVSKENPFI